MRSFHRLCHWHSMHESKLRFLLVQFLTCIENENIDLVVDECNRVVNGQQQQREWMRVPRSLLVTSRKNSFFHIDLEIIWRVAVIFKRRWFTKMSDIFLSWREKGNPTWLSTDWWARLPTYTNSELIRSSLFDRMICSQGSCFRFCVGRWNIRSPFSPHIRNRVVLFVTDRVMNEPLILVKKRRRRRGEYRTMRKKTERGHGRRSTSYFVHEIKEIEAVVGDVPMTLKFGFYVERPNLKKNAL